MGKRVIVVGAGIAGLAAAVYAQKSGFDVSVYESHTIPGGNCSAWRRGGYLFEAGMHWLTGSKNGTAVNKLWRETGAINDESEILLGDPFLTCYSPAGKESLDKASFFRNVDTFESELLKITAAREAADSTDCSSANSSYYSSDRKLIKKMCRDIRKYKAMSMPVLDIPFVKVKKRDRTFLKAAPKMLGALLTAPYYGSFSVTEYAEKFKNPAITHLLKKAINEEYSAVALFFTLGGYMSGDCGYVKGGSLKMTQNMADYFEKIGGKIFYSSRVEKIIVENKNATHIVQNGKTTEADYVIVTQDTLAALPQLFDFTFSDRWTKRLFAATRDNLISCTYICIGVETDLSDEDESLSFTLEKPLEFAGKTITTLHLNNYARYEGHAPKGATALTVLLGADAYDYWKTCKENGTYAEAKEKLYHDVLTRIEAFLPQIRGKAAVHDVATQLTFERYCGTYRGSWMTRSLPGSTFGSFPCKTKDIQNVYFAGQRIQPPGGLPVAIATARKAVQVLCRDTGSVFG
ncbi:MAG: NAD(P)/FAD-dependent oxidoreductase [Treponemataceae bacterium]|nr:MAG: NAD(P)/FAD-dependent oxidoreductase [Treponemataceae bacterium]